MRTVYLVRHGQPDTGFPGQKVCLGRKDVPLTHEGEKQAERLARWFRGKELSGMYTSPLARCRQTAEILAAKSGHVSLPLQTVEDFAEVDTGLWDGLPFPKIREQFPKEFEERGTHLGSYVLPGGESFAEAGARFASAFWTLYENTEGDLMITAHAGVICAFLCGLTGMDADCLMEWNLPYASVTVLEERGDAVQKPAGGKLIVRTAGLRPAASLSLSEADRMWAECRVPVHIREHMETVADLSLQLIGYDLGLARSDVLDEAYAFRGQKLNTRLLYFAALLHDIRRTEGGRIHPEAGAEYLEKQGYLELAPLVRMHHDPEVYRPQEALSEAEILYYADKLVQGSRLVSLEERFGESLKKCTTDEAKHMHALRRQAAEGIAKKLQIQTYTN